VEVPYQPFYAYEETLATFGDVRGNPGSLLSRFERLAGYVTDHEVSALPEVPEADRIRVLSSFTRRAPRQAIEVTVCHVPEDRVWAEWIAAALESAGMSARLAGPQQAARLEEQAVRTRVLAVLSPAFLRSQPLMDLAQRTAQRDPQGRLNLLHLAQVADARLPSAIGRRTVARLSGVVGEDEALAALSRLFEPEVAATVQQASPRLPRFPGLNPAIWNVPPRNASFTGRNRDLDALREQLRSTSMAVVVPVALHGLGGVGKTQVALEYAHRFKSDYDLVWWINAERPDLVSVSLTQLGDRLGIHVGGQVSDAPQEVLSRLRQGEPTARWLVVLDNAEEPAQLAPFLPTGSGHVLITTRLQAWTQTAAQLEIDVFARSESVEHLQRRVNGLSAADADRVAEQLGDLPLAIELAAAWLAETGPPVDEYLEALRGEAARVLSAIQADYPTSFGATWNVSLERLAARSPAAVQLLRICAFMAPSISNSLLDGARMGEELRAIDESLTDPLLRRGVIRELVRLGLARIDLPGQSLQIHRLVQSVVRSGMDLDEQERLEHVVHLILAAARPGTGDTDDPVNWPVFETIWPHLEPSQAQLCRDEPIRQLYTDRVRYLRQIGNFSGALEVGEPLAAQWTRELEAVPREEADSAHAQMVRRNLLHLRYQIANNYRARGHYREAFKLDSEVFEEQTELLGPNHPYTLMTAGSLGASLRAVGRYAEALELDLTTVDRLTETLGEDNARTLSAVNNLAVSYRLTGNCFQARDLDQIVLDFRRVVLGERHPYTLFSGDHLGRDLRETGDYEQSISLLANTLRDLERVLGPDSPSAIETRSSLAVSLRKSGLVDQALEHAELAYERARGTTRGDELSVTLNACALNLATCASATGDHERALSLVRPVLAWYDENLGADHPYAQLCHLSLAISMREMGTRSAEALDEARRAHTSLAAQLGPDHRYTLSAAVTLANCLGDVGATAEAERIEREALRQFGDLLGQNHPDTLACESNLAVSLEANGSKAEAGRIRERIVALLEVRLGADHRNTVKARTGERINLGLEAQPI
jgi:tetratricopeptide (TPR) repeat protein